SFHMNNAGPGSQRVEPVTAGSSGTNDGGGLARRSPARNQKGLAGPFEQHAPLEGAGTHIGKALEYPFLDIRVFGSHQADRLDQAGIEPRLSPGFLQEHLAIEGAMLGTDAGKADVRFEVRTGYITETDRDVRKFGEKPRLVGIGHEARRID